MTTLEHDFSLRRWIRSPLNVVSFVLIWGGFLIALTMGRQAFLWLFGAGLFGPTLLRELGVIRWEDEYQRDTTIRAAFHAFLTTGVLLVSIMAINGFSGTYDDTGKNFQDAVPASTAFFLLVLTWYLSRLLQYWGPRKAAFRIWGSMWIVWLLLTLSLIFVGNREALDPSTPKVIKMLLSSLPCLLLALASLRWPRLTGLVALAYLLWFVLQSGVMTAMQPRMPWEISLDIVILALVPIGAPAVALVVARKH